MQWTLTSSQNCVNGQYQRDTHLILGSLVNSTIVWKVCTCMCKNTTCKCVVFNKFKYVYISTSDLVQMHSHLRTCLLQWYYTFMHLHTLASLNSMHVYTCMCNYECICTLCMKQACVCLCIQTGKTETPVEMLRSILAQLHYQYEVLEWAKKGVPFRSHLYVPEVHPLTGEPFHE